MIPDRSPRPFVVVTPDAEAREWVECTREWMVSGKALPAWIAEHEAMLADIDANPSRVVDAAWVTALHAQHASPGRRWWHHLYCDHCGSDGEATVELGAEPDYESATAWVCRACLLDALAALDAGGSRELAALPIHPPDGREAEELRKGIEHLIEQEMTSRLRGALQDLLDRVNVRGSLSYRIAQDALRAALEAEE